MKLEAAYFFVFAFPLGLAAIGIWIYMRDWIYKRESSNENIENARTLLVKIPCIPFVYFKKMIQEKSVKGLIIFLLFWVTLLSAGFLIHLSNQHTIQSMHKIEANVSPVDTD
jgi:hypothetical protein